MEDLGRRWHRDHPLDRAAGLDDRIGWHLEHALSCGCREAPQPIRDEIAERGLAADALRASTTAGTLVGRIEGEVLCFRGVPFARPPVGDLRWRPPEPLQPWEGLRSAETFGNPCVQHVDAIPVIHERQSTPAEDCLYLNVWTPARRTTGGQPVLVWFHGGAFVVGSGSAEEFDGRRLAELGVVVVTVNYRLGPFGFLSHRGLAAESPTRASGNYGLLDQRAALQWVRDNIAAVGGDPGNVTIVGESAGGISVSCHLASPRSDGLFAKAISQSATWHTIAHGIPDADTDPDAAAADGHAFAGRLGAAGDRRGGDTEEIDRLREISAEEILAATGGRALFAPVVDGWFLPEDPAGLFAAGRVQQVPYLLGWNADEGSRFVPEGRGSAAARDFAQRAAIGPVLTVASSMRVPVYVYRFTRVPDTALAREYGSYHGLEVPYVFGNLPADQGYDDSDRVLSDRMMRCWTAFARSGDPSGDAAAPWPRFDVGSESLLEFG